jgi:hypothetical protein
MNGLRADKGRRYLIEPTDIYESSGDIEVGKGHIGVEVKISAAMSHNTLTTVKEYVK